MKSTFESGAGVTVGVAVAVGEGVGEYLAAITTFFISVAVAATIF
jgi:hypothetical protein